MPPKVTIIIPYKEDRGWLRDAIDSVKGQTYKGEIELILSQSNNGVSYNLNKGVEKSTGDYIKYLCDDDMLTADSIEISVKAMEGVDFIHGRSLVVYEDHNKIEVFTPPVAMPNLKRMLLGNCIHGGSLMYRADVFTRFGMFDETLTTGEEYEFNLRLLSKGCTLGYTHNELYIYRRHDNQKSLGLRVDQRARQKQIMEIRNRYV